MSFSLILIIVIAINLVVVSFYLFYNNKKKNRTKYADTYNQYGLEYLRTNELEEAVEEFDLAIDLNPNDYAFFYNRGLALFRLQNYEKAIESFEDALDLSPDTVEIMVNLGSAHYMNNDYDSALDYYLKSLDIDPDNERANFYIAMEYLRRKQYGQAINSLYKTISINPENYEAKLKLANTLLTIQDFSNSEILFQELAITYPNDYQILYNLGIIKINKHEYNYAISYFEKVLKIKGATPEIILNLSNAHYLNNDFSTAKKTIYEFLNSNPKNAEAYYILGNIFFDESELEKSLKCFNKSVALSTDKAMSLNSCLIKKLDYFEKKLLSNPGDEDTLVKLGFIYLNLKRYDSAEQYIGNAVKVNKNNPITHLYLGKIYLGKDDFRNAKSEFTSTINLSSNNDEAHYLLGSAFIRENDIDSAIDEYETALSINPDNLRCKEDLEIAYNLKVKNSEDYIKSNPRDLSRLYSLSETLLRKGDINDAIEKLTEILGRDQTYLEAYNLLSTIYIYHDKNLEKAAECLEQATEIYPDNLNFQLKFADVYFKQGKYNMAFEKYNAVLDLDKDNDQALCGLGNCYKFRNENNLALEEFNRCILINPDNADAYLGIGDINKSMGKSIEAIDNYSKSLNLKTGNWFAYYKLANIYHDLNDLVNAIENYNHSININPDNPNSYFNLGLAYKDNDNIPKAVEIFETYLAKFPYSPDTKSIIETLKKLKKSI